MVACGIFFQNHKIMGWISPTDFFFIFNVNGYMFHAAIRRHGFYPVPASSTHCHLPTCHRPPPSHHRLSCLPCQLSSRLSCASLLPFMSSTCHVFPLPPAYPSTVSLYLPIASPDTSLSLRLSCLSPPSMPPSAYRASLCSRPHLLHPAAAHAPLLSCLSTCPSLPSANNLPPLSVAPPFVIGCRLHY